MTNQTNEKRTDTRAIVIGGSMAGLLHARVLADYFSRVTIIDRDVFPETPEHRKGVPQSHHAHALLGRGQFIINELFPGIMADLRADGAQVARNVVPIVIVSPAGKLPSSRMEGEFMAFSRYRLEWHVRRRLAERTEVQFVQGTDVDGLLATPDNRRVIGVRLGPRRAAGLPDTLEADLVVDASGRFSKAPEWLQTLGYDAPPEEIVNTGIGYASRFYRKPENFPDEWQGIIINGRAPHNPRAGLILPIENGLWHVTIGGFDGNYPPTDEAGFLAWARSLADPSLYEAIRVAEPVSPIRGYRTPENRLRHFEQLMQQPAGFIATGDSVCAFNPIYGQGMTVSAMDALVLDACLRREQGSRAEGFAQRFQQQIAANVAAPWLVASGEDLRWPGVRLNGAQPKLSTRVQHRFMDLVLRQATEDAVVTEAYMNVISMLAPPQSLAQPRMLLRVLAGTLRRALRRQTAEASFALSTEALTNLQMRPATIQSET